MAYVDRLLFRLADAADAEAIATLHAENWRRHYRGAYSDAFLDGEVAADRLAVWKERLREPDGVACTILAEDAGALVGFAHTVFEHDPTWGSLLDNLHVLYGHSRRGVGSRLLAESALAAIDRSATDGLYLWVLEDNTDAQAFYHARRGRRVEKARAVPPGGIPDRLNGSPLKLRYAWPDPLVLVASR